MRTAQDIEGYLIKMGLKYEEVREGMWVIHDEYDQIDNIVVTFNDPIVLCRVKLMDVPKSGNALGLFRLLLELNASEMISGAYGIEGDAIVATDTLQAENLDFNEFQASVDGLTLCITEHYERLKKCMEPASSGAAGTRAPA